MTDNFLKYSYVSRSTPEIGQPSLLDRDIQLEFYKEIKDLKTTNLDNLLARFRKLREGILASKSTPDDFILNVYLDSIDLCLKSKNWLELYKSLQGILPIFEIVKSKRIHEIQEYFLLYIITWIGSSLDFYKFFIQFKSSHDFSLKVLKTVQDPFAFFEFFSIYKSASQNQRIFLDLKLDSIRNRSFRIISRSFQSMELCFLKDLMGFESIKQVEEFIKGFGQCWTLDGSKVVFKKFKKDNIVLM